MDFPSSLTVFKRLTTLGNISRFLKNIEEKHVTKMQSM